MSLATQEYHPSPGDLLKVEVTTVGADSIAFVGGELDLSTAPYLTDRLPAASPNLVIDLSKLDFLDAVGLSALLQAKQHAERAGRRLTVEGARGLVQRVIEISGIELSDRL